MRKPPQPGTPISLTIVEDRRSLGKAVLTAFRGLEIAGEPADIPEKASQWWFMLGWVSRSVAYGLPDDPAAVVDAFAQFTLATGESRTIDKPAN